MILEIQMAGNQNNSRECRKCSATFTKKEAQSAMTGLCLYGDEYMMYSMDVNLLRPCIPITYRFRIRRKSAIIRRYRSHLPRVSNPEAAASRGSLDPPGAGMMALSL
jgi:hypothetical protein